MPPPSIGSRGRGGGLRILLVDDDAAIRRIYGTALSREGFQVVTAESVEAAGEVVDAQPLPFDAALIDLVLPDGWGSSLAFSLREQQPDVRIIYMSGFTTTDPILRDGIEDHMVFLEKPFTLQELLRVIGDSPADSSI